MGFSPSHGIEVHSILNSLTGHISPQFHIVFDDSFSTLSSLNSIDGPPSFWNEIDLDRFLYQIPLDKDSGIIFGDEWLTPQQREERETNNVQATQICNRAQHYPSATF